MRSIAVFSSAFALAVLATGAQSTVAAEPAEVQALSRAKLSLTQAIETAERHGDGKAIDAEFDGGRGEAPRFEVKILGRDKLTEYTLDADSGKVMKPATSHWRSCLRGFSRMTSAAPVRPWRRPSVLPNKAQMLRLLTPKSIVKVTAFVTR